MIPHWDGTEAGHEAWGIVYLAGIRMPGDAVVDPAKGRKLDKQKSPGNDGARLTDNGADNGSVDVELTITTPDQWAELQSVLGTVYPLTPGATHGPVTIDHPLTQLLEIHDIYIEGVQVARLPNDLVRVRIQAIEWFQQPPPAVSSSSVATATDDGKKPKPTYDPAYTSYTNEPSGAATGGTYASTAYQESFQ